MLSELRLELESKEKLSIYMSSNFHGVIMETIDSAYASALHRSKLNPFSQHLEISDKVEWVICAYTEEAYEKIIIPFMSVDFREFAIKNRSIHIQIQKKELKQISKRELFERFDYEEADCLMKIEFLTPTSFKRDGRYVIFPDLELIYKSLMNKYSAASEIIDMYDENILYELLDNSCIEQYNLRTCFMPLERVKINAFRGSITIRVSGNNILARYVRLLLEFGEYSGVGIKCSIGMGAIKIS